MIHVDTHVAVWLYAGEIDRFPERALAEMRSEALVISAMVSLEIQYLYEIERLTVKAETAVDALRRSLGVEISTSPFGDIVAKALTHTWTRDPFDRIIVADAALGGARLLTKDRGIQANYRKAFWA